MKFYGVTGAATPALGGTRRRVLVPVVLPEGEARVGARLRRAGARATSRAAPRTRSGLDVWGGDAIVTPDGEIFVIDVNAWPSFALFRDEAADHIAAHLAARLRRRIRVAV